MKKLLNKIIKQNNGFTGQDILIAIFIVVLFLSVFTALISNLSTTSVEISDIKKVTESVTKIADRIDALAYNDIGVTTVIVKNEEGKEEEKEEEKEITNLFKDLESDLEKDNLRITYTVTENTSAKSKKIKLKVGKIKNKIKNNGKDESTIENIFEMNLSKQLVVVNEGSGDGDGSGDEPGTAPVESVHHKETIENKELVTTNKIRYINGMRVTDGSGYAYQPGDISILWNNTNTKVSELGDKNSFTYWVAYQATKERR